MNQSRIYIALSVVGVLLAIGIVVKKKIPQDEWNQFVTNGTIPKTLIPSPRKSRVEDAASEDASQEEAMTSLEPVGAEVKDWTELLVHAGAIPRLEQIPWGREDIERAISNFRGGVCRMLPVGTDIYPLPKEMGEIGNPVISFRKSAIVVGLKMDPAGQRELPTVSKGSIESYLANHSLALQATVFRNQEGKLTFAGPVEAAFVSRTSQGQTVSPEPMIKDAVANIRMLGSIPNSDDPNDFSTRTLVLAFSYQRDVGGGKSGLGTTKVTDYELIFLHLVEDQVSLLREPTLIAFATTDGRQKFQEIKPSPTAPNVTATIRFEEFTLMGIYPASPVVTGVRCLSQFSAPTSNIEQRLAGNDQLPPISLSKLLDEIHLASTMGGVRR